MATWTVTLPGEAAVGDPGHVEDHNLIVDALAEIRSVIDGLGDDLANVSDIATNAVTDSELADVAATANAAATQSDLEALEDRVETLEGAGA